MAYAQWVIIILRNVGTTPMKIKNLRLDWGKLHADGDKDREVSVDDYEGKVIGPDQQVRINACGRADSPSGTIGNFDLVDPDEDNKVIRHFYWDCPWGSNKNSWAVTGSNDEWEVKYSGENLVYGPLGTITVEASKILEDA